MAGEEPLRPGPGERPPERTPDRPRRANALVRIKLPLWLVLVLAIAVAVLLGLVLAGRGSVDLGPAVRGAESVEVAVCYPADLAAQRNLDILRAERTLTEALRKSGAREASVRIRRTPDCPLPSPSPSPSPSR